MEPWIFCALNGHIGWNSPYMLERQKPAAFCDFGRSWGSVFITENEAGKFTLHDIYKDVYSACEIAQTFAK